MNIKNLKDFSRNLIYIDVADSVIGLICRGAGAFGVPFPECKIVETSHLSFFAPRPHMPRYFQLEGDSARGCTDTVAAEGDFRTFWLPLTPEDDWIDILWKTDKLAALSGDRHHRVLEGFSVVEDILIPNFGS